MNTATLKQQLLDSMSETELISLQKSLGTMLEIWANLPEQTDNADEDDFFADF